MNLQENIERIHEIMGIIKEVRVPRGERVELYKDENIIVIVPLTHRALKKYANKCQWCINSDLDEWEDYHQGKHAVILQRNPKNVNIGVTNNPTPTEIFFIAKWDNNESSFEDVCDMLGYEFIDDRSMENYYINLTNDINNFGVNIVYYSPENGVYDQEDNFLWNFNYDILDIPNITPEVIKIIDDYLTNESEGDIHEMVDKVITEDRKEMFIRNMIDDIGIENTIKMVGDYHEVEPFLKLIDKINYIKEKVGILDNYSDEGIALYELNEEPIYYTEEDGELHQIEYLYVNKVMVDVYGDGIHMVDYAIPYESLSVDIIEELFDMLLDK